MGAGQSTEETDHLKRLYSPQEWEQLQRLFVSLAAQSRSNGQHIIASAFQAYYGIHGSLGARLFEIATQGNKDGLMRFQEFAAIKAVFDKGSPGDLDRMCFQVMDVLKSGKVDRREVEEVVRSAFATLFGPQHSLSSSVIHAFVTSAFPAQPSRSSSSAASAPALRSSAASASALPSSANPPAASSAASPVELGKEAGRPEPAFESTQKGRLEQGVGVRGGEEGKAGAVDSSCNSRELSYHDAVRWWAAVPAVKKFLRSLLTHPDLRPPLPTLIAPAVNASGRYVSTGEGTQQQEMEPTWLLQKELTWHIAGALQDKECREWCLVYSSRLHGLSFNSFLGKVSSVPHPTILVVRDSAGAVLGAFASKPWERSSAFFGDMRSFLFSFLPVAAVYKAAGTSTNIQWCASGFASESIPNGVGFGGQPGHFGLFLSADFDSGHSRPSTTFNSPSLSSTPTFTIDEVECWSVNSASLSDRISAGGSGACGGPGSRVASGRSDGDGSGSGSGGGTVLDRFGNDRAMLGFMGIATASEIIGRDITDCCE